MTSGLVYQKKCCKSKRFPVRRSWQCWRRRTRPRRRSWRKLLPWMGGLQRGRAGGCNVMRRPQVAAQSSNNQLSISTSIWLLLRTLCSFSPQNGSSSTWRWIQCSILRKEQLRTLRLELAKKQRMVSQHQLIGNIALTFQIDKTKKRKDSTL